MVKIRRPNDLSFGILSSKRRKDANASGGIVGLCRNNLVFVVILLVVLCTAFLYSNHNEGVVRDSSSLGRGYDTSSKSKESLIKEVLIHEVVTVPMVIYANSKDSTNSHNADNTKPRLNLNMNAPVRHLSIQEMMNPEHQQARTKPLLLTGWKEYQSQSNGDSSNDSFSVSMQEENFQKEFGNYTQYVKNQFVQPLKDKQDRKCLATSSSIVKLMKMKSKSLGIFTGSTDMSKFKNADKDNGDHLLFFTNDLESPDFFRALKATYTIPSPLHYGADANAYADTEDKSGLSFHVFSAMVQGSFHGFHKHDDAHIYQIHGRKMWWFLPPDTKTPPKNNPCLFLVNSDKLHEGQAATMSVLQQPGETIHVPKNWWHATCALDDWTIAVGMQRGSPHKYEQKFESLPQPFVKRSNANANDKDKTHTIDEKIHPMPWADGNVFQTRMEECGVKFDWNDPKSWIWFNGDLNAYYNKLIASDSKRNPNVITSYAVHRWMGKDKSTLIHYELIHGMIQQFMEQSESRNLRLLDAGCGLGAGLMWFETNAPKVWSLVGHTISTAQLEFINKLPSHKFDAVLKSYDDLEIYKEEDTPFDVMYSIEAFIHSPDERNTLKKWSEALADGGIIVIVDDFLSVGVDKESDDVQLFSKSWMANVLQTTSSLSDIAEKFGLELVVDRDLGSEYQVVKRNYRNRIPDIRPTKKKNHQGWLGSGMRQRLMVEGKITYRLIVFQKKGGMKSSSSSVALSQVVQGQCASVPLAPDNESLLDFQPLEAEHRTGKGNDGGSKQKCISGWYCCGQGEEWWDNLESKRTHNTSYLKLDKSLFGNYMDEMVEHLNTFYRQLPSGVKGKFLDIGGTGSVSSGMSKVTSKFAHFAGPFDYWVLDSDSAAKGLDNALHCDMGDCPEALDCEFDVTFSHTVIEHSSRPWHVFDEIARITKKGGLTLHVVPFSYQYHATPDDNFRFSHKALTSLLEDRGFKILDVGYDICTKPEKVLKNNIDEHFDVIWLTYVVGQKL